MKSFAEYKQTAPNWITMTNGEFYPDILTDACELYKPVLVLFGQLINPRIRHLAPPWIEGDLCERWPRTTSRLYVG